MATLPGVLGLVGPVSVYCGWVREKVGSVSVWSHVPPSQQIRPLRYTTTLLGR